MPLYDLKCSNCNYKEFDTFFHMTEQKQKDCPVCNGLMSQYFTKRSIPQIADISIEPEYDYTTGRYVKPSERKEHCIRDILMSS